MSSSTDEIYEDDIKEIKEIMDAIEMPVPIKKVYRMKRKSRRKILQNLEHQHIPCSGITQMRLKTGFIIRPTLIILQVVVVVVVV